MLQKNPAVILIEIMLNVSINLEIINVLTVLSLPIHEHVIALHLFRSF